MTDIDLMSETQVAVMFVLAVGVWTALAWTLYRRNRPKRTRRTYHGGLMVDTTLGLPPRRLRRQAKKH